MFKILILAAQNNIADAPTEYLIWDWPSWLRFLGFEMGASTLDVKTIRLFRETLTKTKAIMVLFDAFYNRLSGDRRTDVDATLVSLLGGAKGHGCPLNHQVCQSESSVNGKPYIDIAISSFGYKSHIAICRGYASFVRLLENRLYSFLVTLQGGTSLPKNTSYL
jgi:transposase, IS5 family